MPPLRRRFASRRTIWPALASVGTLIVVIVTAFAALRQLRMLAHANHVTAISDAVGRWNSEEIRASREFVLRELPALLEDPAFRAQLESDPLGLDALRAVPILNYFEVIGSYVRFGVVNEQAALSILAGLVLTVWNAASPAIAIMRRAGPSFENFEYVAMLARRRTDALDGGDDYPRGAPRMNPEDRWLAEDRAEASRRVGEGVPGG
jgi:hypothetical protein